jgi:hypothetical protein
VSVFAASVDTGENAKKIADDLSYAIGEGVTRAEADTIGGWWEDRRSIVQPSQFLMRRDGSIIQSTYSDGPLGRLDAPDVCGLVNFVLSQ